MLGQLDIFGTPTQEPTFEQEYQAYIASPRWRLKRLQALTRAEHKCEHCGASRWSARLEVHHKTYERFRCEQPLDLEVLCERCHKKADDARREEVARRRRERQAESLWEARLDGWATKIYGEFWQDRHDVDRIEDEFAAWLDRHGDD